MINPTTLRIGNQVKQSLSSLVHTIKELREDVIIDERGMSYNYGEISGVAITEEILLKAGFEKAKSCFLLHDESDLKFYIKIEAGEDEVEYFLNAEDYDGNSFEGTEDNYIHLTQIKAFHHLQNIVHDLTGKEIKI